MPESAAFRIAYIFFDIILPLIVGYMLKRYNRLSSETCNKIIRFNIVVVMTVLAVLSFWILPLRQELIALPFFAYLNVIIPWGLAKVFKLDKRFVTSSERGSYLITVIPSNVAPSPGCAVSLCTAKFHTPIFNSWLSFKISSSSSFSFPWAVTINTPATVTA